MRYVSSLNLTRAEVGGDMCAASAASTCAALVGPRYCDAPLGLARPLRWQTTSQTLQAMRTAGGATSETMRGKESVALVAPSTLAPALRTPCLWHHR